MKNNSKGLTPMYIILVPIVLVVVLLNSGLLQKLFPAATVHGEAYQVTQYNYYYFTVYNAFLETDYESEGFDPSRDAEQQTRSDGSTWFDWFCRQADQRLSEVVYYNALAQAAGYSFSEEELSPMDARLAELKAQAAVNSLSMKDYYVAYFGTGMTETIFLQELRRDVQADAYRAHLVEAEQPTAEEIDLWLSQHPTEDYLCADLQLIVLNAAADRFSGVTEQRQLDDLAARLDRLAQRYEASPPSFPELAAAYSAHPDAVENGGLLEEQRKEDLPDAVAEWCFGGAQPGDLLQKLDRETGEGYLAVLTGWSGSAARREAAAALREDHVAQAAQAALSGYGVSHNAFGMKLAGK